MNSTRGSKNAVTLADDERISTIFVHVGEDNFRKFEHFQGHLLQELDEQTQCDHLVIT